MTNDDLDSYELEMENAFSKGKLIRAKNFAAEKSTAQKAADNYLKKSERVSLRLTPSDLQAIKTTAVEEGIPYQTLISGILHKFVTGRLIDIKYIDKFDNK